MMSKANRRYLRSILMLVFALGVMIWTAADQFDIPIADMQSLFLTTATVVGGIIIAAAVLLLLLKLFRKLFAGARKSDSSDS